jgi:hypothetical protein
LVADYLRMMGEEGLARFDATMAADPADPRGCLRNWLVDLLAKANKPDYRGCGTTNAAVEYPDKRHPARKVSSNIKTRFRAKLRSAAAAMGASDPDSLGDALMLLLEGVYSSGQLFGEGGPARVVIEAADAVIDRYLAKDR